MLSVAAMADCTVYYAGDYAAPYVYAWSTSTTKNAAWPGQAMTATSYTYGGYTVYSYTMTTTTYPNCIFSDKGSGQTADLVTECGAIYYNDQWIAYTPGDTATAVTPTTPVSGVAVPDESEDVMLQGFYWDSHSLTKYGRTKWIDYNNNNYAQEIGQAGFTMVWLPSPCASDGGLGYHPKQWSSLDGGMGTSSNLKTLIKNLHNSGVKVIADIVVNHRASSSGWCAFMADNFGSAYGSTSAPNGQYQFTEAHICSDDEAFTDTKSNCKGSTTTGAKDSGVETYAAARDLDHSNVYVRDAVKSYLAFLKGNAGFDGWRYDLVKSYAAQYLEEYNLSSQPYFSVTEYYDGNASTLKAYVKKCGYHTLTFDFATKYYAFNNGIAKGQYNNLIGEASKLFHMSGMSKYAVTFIDNHDTFERSDATGNEFYQYNCTLTAAAPKKLVLQANAYLLAMPGVPCVFWPHWRTFQTEINAMIAARKAAGIHSESQIISESAQNGQTTKGYYEAYVQGHKGVLCIQIGNGLSSYLQDKTAEGYTLMAQGSEYKMWVKQSGTAVETVEACQPARKVMENGRVYIEVDGVRYDMMGRRM